MCHTAVRKSAVLCEGCSLICHSRCTGGAPVSCDLQTQMRTYSQQSNNPTLPLQDVSGTRTAQSPISSLSPNNETPPSSFPGHVMSGWRKLRHSASSMGDMTAVNAARSAERRLSGRSSEDRSRSRASGVSPLPDSLRSSSSGGPATPVTGSGSHGSGSAPLPRPSGITQVSVDSAIASSAGKTQSAVTNASAATSSNIPEGTAKRPKRSKSKSEGQCVVQ